MKVLDFSVLDSAWQDESYPAKRDWLAFGVLSFFRQMSLDISLLAFGIHIPTFRLPGLSHFVLLPFVLWLGTFPPSAGTSYLTGVFGTWAIDLHYTTLHCCGRCRVAFDIVKSREVTAKFLAKTIHRGRVENGSYHRQDFLFIT